MEVSRSLDKNRLPYCQRLNNIVNPLALFDYDKPFFFFFQQTRLDISTAHIYVMWRRRRRFFIQLKMKIKLYRTKLIYIFFFSKQQYTLPYEVGTGLAKCTISYVLIL